MAMPAKLGVSLLFAPVALGFGNPPPPPSSPPSSPLAPECPGSCFFISEYVEPADSSQDGFVELYNGCEEPVNIREYSMLLCRDGCEGPDPAAGSDGVREGALQVALAVQDHYINPGAMFTIVYCEEVLTSRCANHNLVARASSGRTLAGPSRVLTAALDRALHSCVVLLCGPRRRKRCPHASSHMTGPKDERAEA